MAAPQITLYTGDVPNRATDSATEFANNADDMVNYIAIIPDEYNELADFVNGAAETAQASANFEGNWSSLSGAYSAGTGVYHDGITWLLLVNLSSIQSSEPSSSNSNWLALASLTQQSTNTANIATNATNIATNANDISEIKNDDISLSGVKTFTSSPIVPTPTTDTQAANKEYVDGLAIGVGQTWQDVTASRSAGVTYTNTTGRTIIASICWDSGADVVGSAYIGSTKVKEQDTGSTTAIYTNWDLIIPDGQTYSITISDTILFWVELR